ncbi:MAG: hypothetical protein WCK90_00640 [archaeon]
MEVPIKFLRSHARLHYSPPYGRQSNNYHRRLPAYPLSLYQLAQISINLGEEARRREQKRKNLETKI